MTFDSWLKAEGLTLSPKEYHIAKRAYIGGMKHARTIAAEEDWRVAAVIDDAVQVEDE